jgi:hypothetical protein
VVGLGWFAKLKTITVKLRLKPQTPTFLFERPALGKRHLYFLLVSQTLPRFSKPEVCIPASTPLHFKHASLFTQILIKFLRTQFLKDKARIACKYTLHFVVGKNLNAVFFAQTFQPRCFVYREAMARQIEPFVVSSKPGTKLESE